jgi:hypothetical protein
MAPLILPVLQRLAEDFEDLGHRFAVVGGLAVGARARPRTTQDIDIALAVENNEQAEAVVYQLLHRGYQVSVVLNHAESDEMLAVRLIPPPPPDIADRQLPICDLLFRSSGIEHEVVQNATPAHILKHLVLPTVCIPELIVMKLISVGEHRESDGGDLYALMKAATPQDLERVPPLIDRVIERGRSRGRDLHASFAHYRKIADQPREPWE